jgi:hypothetical protein
MINFDTISCGIGGWPHESFPGSIAGAVQLEGANKARALSGRSNRKPALNTFPGFQVLKS